VLAAERDIYRSVRAIRELVEGPRANGPFTLTHTNNAQTDRLFL
jgi:hypothetical protein